MTQLDVHDELGDLYHAGYRRLVAQVYAFTTDLTEAQDAVQEAFARALARHNGLTDIDSPEAWLRTVAVNIVRRRWRRRKLLNAILLRERPLAKVVQDAPAPDRADLRDALAAIPRTYREVIVLHYLADLPVGEVAAILEVPVGTVKSRLSRGREALRGLLDDVEAPPLEQVKKRARTIRTRRRAAQATAALAVVLVAVVVFFPRGGQQDLPPGASPGPVLSYAGSGLTLRSVPDVLTVPDLPGTIVEFDVDGAGVLRTDAGTWARSRDGGQTWEILSEYTPAPKPGWGTWRAPRLSAGVLWEAGIVDSVPTVRADGKDITLDTSGDGITATVHGDQVTVMVVEGKTIISVYQGNAAGLSKVSDGGGMTISGEPIVLPDGRMVVADTQSTWQISTDRGATWAKAGGSMPVVGSLRMTSDGYVALDLFRAGWVAISADGVSWQKLPIR